MCEYMHTLVSHILHIYDNEVAGGSLFVPTPKGPVQFPLYIYIVILNDGNMRVVEGRVGEKIDTRILDTFDLHKRKKEKETVGKGRFSRV